MHLVEIGDISQLSGSTSPTAPLYDEYDVSPVCPICGNKMRPNDVKDGTLYRYKNSLNAIRYFEFRCKHCGSQYHTDPFIYNIESTNAIYALSSADKTHFFKSEGEMDKYVFHTLGEFDLEGDPCWPIFVVPLILLFCLTVLLALLDKVSPMLIFGIQITTKTVKWGMIICGATSLVYYFINKFIAGACARFPDDNKKKKG